MASSLLFWFVLMVVDLTAVQTETKAVTNVAKDGRKYIFTTNSCRLEFQGLPNHTMCLIDNPDVLESGVTLTTKEFIVKEHNRIRGAVIPPATDLTEVVWDDKLAEVAEKWARQCKKNHDQNRDIPGYGVTIGQNTAWGYHNWSGALYTWYKEINTYHFGETPEKYLPEGKTWEDIGHYTQIIYNSSVRLGCGFAMCRPTIQRRHTRFYVCNYAEGQGFRQDFPYTNGTRCSACPDHCDGGICMCGGRICLNGGKLKLATCGCECPSLFGGDHCQDVICPDQDAWYCGRKWPASMCTQFVNVPQKCPYMCGMCPDPNKQSDMVKQKDMSRDKGESMEVELEDTCREEFRRIPGHTMCLNDSKKVIQTGVSEADKVLIVEEHNRIRGSVEPSATDLPNLIWDDRLAEVAAKWARQCTSYHDKVKIVPNYGLSIGQNAAWGSLNWMETIHFWFEEVKKYRYGEKPEAYLPEGYLEIGHYTQLVYNTTVRVGCGFAKCQMDSGDEVPFYFCNYAPGQGYRQDLPYINGTQCSACPDRCEQGLCQCGGKLCRNHGMLNVTSCECVCSHIYQGEVCEEVVCPPEDAFFCGTSVSCGDYANAPSLCPYMCGLCMANSNIGQNTTSALSTLETLTSNATSVSKLTTISLETITQPQTSVQPNTQRHTVTEQPLTPEVQGKTDALTTSRALLTTSRFEHKLPSGNESAEVLDSTTEITVAKPNLTYATTRNSVTPTKAVISKKPSQTPMPLTSPKWTEETLKPSRFVCPNKRKKGKPGYCRKFGDEGEDKPECLSMGGTLDCSHCIKKPFAARRQCPVMCGFCKAPVTKPVVIKPKTEPTKSTKWISVSTSSKSSLSEPLTTTTRTPISEAVISTTRTPISEAVISTTRTPISEAVISTTRTQMSEPLTTTTGAQLSEPLASTTRISVSEPLLSTTRSSISGPLPSTRRAAMSEPRTATRWTTVTSSTAASKVVKTGPSAGKRESSEKCRQFGDRGLDRPDCQSQGGPWGCEQCQLDPDFPRNFCPVMCGLCDPVCGKLRCENGGTLKRKQCSCICGKYFYGERCERVKCPRKDPWYCGVHPPPSYCQAAPFSETTKQECPHMCGVC